jgi:hypothetical protein
MMHTNCDLEGEPQAPNRTFNPNLITMMMLKLKIRNGDDMHVEPLLERSIPFNSLIDKKYSTMPTSELRAHHFTFSRLQHYIVQYFELPLDLAVDKLFVTARVDGPDRAVTLKMLIQDENTFHNAMAYLHDASSSQTTGLDVQFICRKYNPPKSLLAPVETESFEPGSLNDLEHNRDNDSGSDDDDPLLLQIRPKPDNAPQTHPPDASACPVPSPARSDTAMEATPEPSASTGADKSQQNTEGPKDNDATLQPGVAQQRIPTGQSQDAAASGIRAGDGDLQDNLPAGGEDLQDPAAPPLPPGQPHTVSPASPAPAAKPVTLPHRELSLHPSPTPSPINASPGPAETSNEDPKVKIEPGEAQAGDPVYIDLTAEDPNDEDSNNDTNTKTFAEDLGVNGLESTDDNGEEQLVSDAARIRQLHQECMPQRSKFNSQQDFEKAMEAWHAMDGELSNAT